MATLDARQIADLAQAALERAGTRGPSAASLARAVAAAEMDGIRSHGLVYVPIYCEHVQCGKVDGNAIPDVGYPGTASISVDARDGFAHLAIDAGFDDLIPRARETGMAAVSVKKDRKSTRLNSSHDQISYAVFCLKKKKKTNKTHTK